MVNKKATPHLFEKLDSRVEDNKHKDGDKICFEMNQVSLQGYDFELGKKVSTSKVNRVGEVGNIVYMGTERGGNIVNCGN